MSTLIAPDAPMAAAVRVTNHFSSLTAPGGASLTSAELDDQFGVTLDVLRTLEEKQTLPGLLSACMDPVQLALLRQAHPAFFSDGAITGAVTVVDQPLAQVQAAFNGTAGAPGSTYLLQGPAGGGFFGFGAPAAPALVTHLLPAINITAELHTKLVWVLHSAALKEKNKLAIARARGASEFYTAQAEANIRNLVSDVQHQLNTANMTPMDCVNMSNIFSLHIEGKDARARGSAMYRAMMGQSDAVKVAMLKHMVLMKVDAFNGETRERVRRLRASFRLYD